MSAIPFVLEDRLTRELVRDLNEAKPAIYWADFLVTVITGWTGFAMAVMLRPFSAGMLCAGALAAAALYRGLCFIHEITHQSARVLPKFEGVWNLLIGYPLLMPSFVYTGVHQSHHRLSTYGTSEDPEYLPFARNSAMTALFALQSFLIPVALAIRFLPLSVIGFVYPPFQRWLVAHFSSLTMNPAYRREATPRLIRTVRMQSGFLLLLWLGFAGMAQAKILPWRFFAVWLGVSALISFVNTLRTLGAHAYESAGDPLDREGQLRDSIDTPGAPWTELWAPVGLRYHALHHFFPGIPYHNLPQAWRRISAELPPDAIYREVQSRGLAWSLSALYRKGLNTPLRIAERMHFGIISPPVPGHLNPFGALGRELIAHGHRATVFQMTDVEERVIAEGLEFVAIGQTDHPRGSLPESLAQLGRLHGLAALRFTIQAVRKTTEMFFRDAPAAIRDAGIDLLLVDQTEPAGGTLAEYLGMPFVTICNALILNRDAAVPPPFTAWTGGTSWWQRARNNAGYAISAQAMSPVTKVVASYRRRWNLPAHRRPEDSFSKLAQISQQPEEFDFPHRGLPDCFHYAGPLRDDRRPEVSFPWHKLDGRALIYASLGTLQYSREEVFRCFAEACAGLGGTQLVIAHCGGLTEAAIASLPGDPVTVPYAPQAALLQRAQLVLTHAGLNTVLDALRFGVPIVAVPITYEQPAIAARVQWAGAGTSIPLARLNPARLRAAIREVLENPRYAQQSSRIAASIRRAGGTGEAVRIIESLARRAVPAYR